MKDLSLRRDLCQKFNIPLRILIGRISHLHLNVPWNALSSQPVRVEVDNVVLLVEPVDEGDWDEAIRNMHSAEEVEKHIAEQMQVYLNELLAKKRDELQAAAKHCASPSWQTQAPVRAAAAPASAVCANGAAASVFPALQP